MTCLAESLRDPYTCSSSSSSPNAMGCAIAALSWVTSSSPSQRLMTTVATPLPTRLVSARHSHEFVDAEQDGERLDRNVGHDRKRRRQRHEARSGHARRTLRRDHGDGQDAELLADA